MTLNISSYPPMISLRDIQQCCVNGFFITHTTLQCPLYSHCPFLMSYDSFSKVGYHLSIIFFVRQGYLFHYFSMTYLQTKTLTYSSTQFFFQFWHHIIKQLSMSKCLRTPFLFGYTYVVQFYTSHYSKTIWYVSELKVVDLMYCSSQFPTWQHHSLRASMKHAQVVSVSNIVNSCMVYFLG